MAHGGYDKRRVTRRKPSGNSYSNKNATLKSKTSVGGVHKSKIDKKSKSASLKNQIRSCQRLLQRELPAELKVAQEKKLEELHRQQAEHNRLATERKIFLRDKKIKFFERRKIERRLRRLEKQQRISSSHSEEKSIVEELGKLKEDLEYVRFFPKTEKYVPLFCGDDNTELEDSRKRLRIRIKDNIAAAAASGKDLEETGSDDDGLIDITDDDFFVSGSSSDEADADDELTDINAREQARSASEKTASGISDLRNQKQKSTMALMPPPRPLKSSAQRFDHGKASFGSHNRRISHSNDRRVSNSQAGQRISHSSDRGVSNSQAGQRISHSSDRGVSNSQAGQSSNISSNSDAPKKRRKRRPKKKKQ